MSSRTRSHGQAVDGEVRLTGKHASRPTLAGVDALRRQAKDRHASPAPDRGRQQR